MLFVRISISLFLKYSWLAECIIVSRITSLASRTNKRDSPQQQQQLAIPTDTRSRRACMHACIRGCLRVRPAVFTLNPECNFHKDNYWLQTDRRGGCFGFFSSVRFVTKSNFECSYQDDAGLVRTISFPQFYCIDDDDVCVLHGPVGCLSAVSAHRIAYRS